MPEVYQYGFFGRLLTSVASCLLLIYSFFLPDWLRIGYVFDNPEIYLIKNRYEYMWLLCYAVAWWAFTIVFVYAAIHYWTARIIVDESGITDKDLFGKFHASWPDIVEVKHSSKRTEQKEFVIVTKKKGRFFSRFRRGEIGTQGIKGKDKLIESVLKHIGSVVREES